MTDTIRTADLAHEVCVSRQMVAKWSREGLENAAKVGHGKWDREAALQWIAERREDVPPGSATPAEAASLTEQRRLLYRSQTEYSDIRNGVAKNLLVYRDAASRAFSEYAAAQLADIESWTQDTSDPAAQMLLKRGMTAAEVQVIKTGLANELRRRQAELVRGVDAVLSTVEDVGAARIRLSGRMG